MKTIEYYLMRHAEYYDQENQYVSYRGMVVLKRSLEKLAEELLRKYPKKNLRIIHSALPRAKHTALLAQEIITGMQVILKSDVLLNSDKLQINEAYIKQQVSRCEDNGEICLILSHQPDIKHFCSKKLQNSECISMSIELEEKTADASNEGDDLPF